MYFAHFLNLAHNKQNSLSCLRIIYYFIQVSRMSFLFVAKMQNRCHLRDLRHILFAVKMSNVLSFESFRRLYIAF